MKAERAFGSLLERKPIDSLKVMSVGNPWAYEEIAGNSLSLSSRHG
jgi:hypothetical protein